MTERPNHFAHHRQAALALLSECHAPVAQGRWLPWPCLHCAVLSDNQRDWLVKLLDRQGLPPLAPWQARDAASQRLGEVQ